MTDAARPNKFPLIPFITVALVILFVFSAYKIYQAQPPEQPKPQSPEKETPIKPVRCEGEKDYENKEFGFSFKYPCGWEVKHSEATGWPGFFNGVDLVVVTGGAKGGMSGTDTVESYCENPLKTINKMEAHPMDVDGEPAIYCTAPTSASTIPDPFNFLFLVQKGDQQLEIKGNLSSETPAEAQKTFESFLRSLKFL